MARNILMRHLPFSESTTTAQAISYLLGVALFSISFLVFLNSSISFVITDLIGVHDGVGDIVGTLGFVDELVALIACPLWGLISDRLGVRFVAMVGYAVIGLSLFLFVQASNVYPQLLLARILFAIGATATATMVTATLPCLTDDSDSSDPETEQPTLVPGHNGSDDAREKPSILAGYVGLFTGLGALVSLVVFLPLPSQFSKIEGVEIGEAVQYSYYVVGAVAILVASFVYIGLRKLKGEEGKGFRTLFGLKKRRLADGSEAPRRSFLPYRQLLRDAIVLGVTDSQIGLGYLGGFVARASTVAISAFIPLFVKIYFLDHISDGDQRKAYVLASILTGVAQLFALIFAPIFGYLSRRRGRFDYPVIVATIFGIVGYIIFPHLASPEVKNVDGRGGSPTVFVLVALIGISQIGAIVCSLGSLGKGVLAADPHKKAQPPADDQVVDGVEANEDTSLLNDGTKPQPRCTRVLLKGTIAGVYSWCGGAAILLLTKLGGFLFDTWSHGAPFYMMALFNAILLVATLGVSVVRLAREHRHKHT
ncbi:hypothetical protein M406DRAFT_96544 [Cryphonectria parasitica EP155]|uniref:MFS transporter n=1 Tax=Cryphonectria parasitica (strain ATCC 38755 / EP155) TaxID=660469 RepID=A0A9P4YA45_CRYP1|nr:uncharacterized protein M406DRAFT_96544 [Cryphonectria parasitica EP155]KAF3769809.1 hypothetical protein M406DRAFT_96544 [Cryphonectria parasitica EP155]